MLFTDATIITVNEKREILLDGSILVQNNIIADIGNSDVMKGRYPTVQQMSLSGRIIIPGLVSTHMHTAQTLIRGAADDLELVSWLCERIWVFQGNYTEEDARASVEISIAEMLKTGTTCFLESMFADRYNFNNLCDVVEKSGIRGCLGKIVMDIARYANNSQWSMHPGMIETKEQSLGGAIKMWEKWNGAANDRIRVWFAPRPPGGVTEELYLEMSAISKAKGIPITMHCAEVKADRAFHESVSHTPTSYCEDVGLLGPQTVLVHMVHLDDSDIKKLAETGTHVAHCPTSNCKLASGICRVRDMQKAGVNIGLGTDGAPCNNSNDMFQEMKLASILHKAVSFDPKAVPAEDVLEMATINGARALGLESSIGSLEIGKKADFVAINTESVRMKPWYSPVSAVVYSATGSDVDTVVVDGQIIVQHGTLLTMNEDEICKRADQLGHEVVKRAGKTEDVWGKWPLVQSVSNLIPSAALDV